MVEAWYGRFKTKVQEEEKRLSIQLLGPPEVGLKEQPPLRFRTKKASALLCYLAAKGGRHPRRELAELLWPRSEEHHARTDLRSVLYKLRKSLGEESTHDEEGGFFIIDGDLLGLEPKGIELDLNALRTAVSLARSETSPGGTSAADDVRRRELIGFLQGALVLQPHLGGMTCWHGQCTPFEERKELLIGQKPFK